jgi:hypothetical protein
MIARLLLTLPLPLMLMLVLVLALHDWFLRPDKTLKVNLPWSL